VSFEPRFSITEPITAALTRIERARGFLDAAKLSDDWLATMRSRALLLEAHHTTHMDGTRLTLEQTEQILAGRAVPDADADDAREVLNYRDALEFTTGYLNDAGAVTDALIRDVHKRLVDGVDGGAATPGEYRSVDGYVVKAGTRQVIYRPAAAAYVPILVGDLVAWLSAERDAHPVVVAGIGQFQLTHLHPFLDGNGRTSRLVSTLCLWRAGYDFKRVLTISEYDDRNRTAFYRAQQGVRDTGMDVTGWLEFFTGGLATQLDAVKSAAEREIRRDVVARHGLTERQAAAVGHVLDEGRLTIGDFDRLCPGATRRALQRELKQLVDKGLLRRAGAANRPHYLGGEELT
jgi:Fic family protein